MRTELQYQENEVVTISLERYEMLRRCEQLIDDTERKMAETNNKLTKEIATNLLNNFRSYYSLYLGEDPYKTEIID